MIVSHKYKYVFIQLPRSGSTAIGKELRLNYDGIKTLRKHSTYHDFLKVATQEERDYLVFSCIRNPLDSAVSAYFKYVTDHRHRFSDPKRIKWNTGLVSKLDNLVYRFLQRTNADFEKYFMTFYRVPYNNWASLSHRQFDAVIHFEHLAEDFEKVIQMLGIDLVRPLPVVNKTNRRDRGYLDYYTPRTIKHAKYVFGPFMKEWGYSFPAEWGDASISRWERFQFNLINYFRTFYWKHLRYRI